MRVKEVDTNQCPCLDLRLIDVLACHNRLREQPSALAAVVPHLDGDGWASILSGAKASKGMLMGDGVVIVPNLASPRALEETLTVTQVMYVKL